MIRETTITFKGVEFEVEFEYQEAEPAKLYDEDYSGSPGCTEEVKDWYSITHQDTDFSELLEVFEKEINELILKSI